MPQCAAPADTPERCLNIPNRVLLCWNLEHLRETPTSLSVWRVIVRVQCSMEAKLAAV